MVAIVVEGNRDIKFFKHYISNFLNIDKTRYKLVKTDGKSKLLDDNLDIYKTLLEDIDGGRVRNVFFILDADNSRDNPDIGGYDNSVKAINNLIAKLAIGTVSDFLVACDPAKKEGNIESLVVSALDKRIVRCIENFLECSELEKSEGKRLLGIYNYGYPQKPYDFSHANFDELKNKLTKLFEQG